MTTFLALVMMAQTACGYSPILNHRTPNRTQNAAEQNSEAEGKVSLNCRFQFKVQNLCADFVWVKEPKNSDDEGSMKIYFWNPNQPSIYVSPAVASVGVKLWMTSMGHGSGKVTVSPALDASGNAIGGIYDATGVNFVMGGDWDIFLQLKDSGGKVIAAEKVGYFAQ